MTPWKYYNNIKASYQGLPDEYIYKVSMKFKFIPLKIVYSFKDYVQYIRYCLFVKCRLSPLRFVCYDSVNGLNNIDWRYLLQISSWKFTSRQNITMKLNCIAESIRKKHINDYKC